MTSLVLAVSSGLDPVLFKIVLMVSGIILFSFLLKSINQPYVLAYMMAGVFLGPHVIGVVSEESFISALGSFGLILLLFFIGMEISITDLITNWRISIIGTLIQVLISIGFTWFIGFLFNWSISRIVTLGFVISLSSTAVIIKLLHERNELNSKLGQNVVGILLAQDVIIIPMIIVLNYFGGKEPSTFHIIKQIIGGILFIGIIWYVIRKGKLSFPFQNYVRRDHEIQVFLAIAICFGFSLLTSILDLSSALGAFVAGILVSSFRATHWVKESLHAFRVVFVALFFVSIGMLIDLKFMRENIYIVGIFVVLVLVVNNLINALIFKLFGQGWRNSIYAGAILAQIGEFSFIIGSTAYMLNIITVFTYKLIISIISLTLIISPLWISGIRTLLRPKIESGMKRIFR